VCAYSATRKTNVCKSVQRCSCAGARLCASGSHVMTRDHALYMLSLRCRNAGKCCQIMVWQCPRW